MKIIKIDNMGIENDCQKYLEKLVEDNSQERVVIWGHKYKIVVENIDTFNKLAQKMKITEINNCSGVDYVKKIQDESWTIALKNELTEDFLNKYGKKYKIN